MIAYDTKALTDILNSRAGLIGISLIAGLSLLWTSLGLVHTLIYYKVEPPKPSSETNKARKSHQLASKNTIQTVANLHLFGNYKLNAVARTTQDKSYVLKGVIIDANQKNSFAILKISNAPEEMIKQGDRLPNGKIVDQINHREIVVKDTSGNLESIPLFPPEEE